MNISYCIEKLVPNALYNTNQTSDQEINEEFYNNIQWLDSRDKPSWHDIKVEWFNYLKEYKDNEICKIRDEKIAEGVPYIFPSGETGHIQTRDMIDHRNIQANGSAAQTLLMLGQTEQVMYFRDVENIIHELYPQQMVEMCMFCMCFGQNIYSNSWLHKDNIQNIIIIDDDVDTALEQIINYDIYDNWVHLKQHI